MWSLGPSRRYVYGCILKANIYCRAPFSGTGLGCTTRSRHCPFARGRHGHDVVVNTSTFSKECTGALRTCPAHCRTGSDNCNIIIDCRPDLPCPRLSDRPDAMLQGRLVLGSGSPFVRVFRRWVCWILSQQRYRCPTSTKTFFGSIPTGARISMQPAIPASVCAAPKPMYHNNTFAAIPTFSPKRMPASQRDFGACVVSFSYHSFARTHTKSLFMLPVSVMFLFARRTPYLLLQVCVVELVLPPRRPRMVRVSKICFLTIRVCARAILGNKH